MEIGELKEIKIKKWFIEKEDRIARTYNTFMDWTDTEDGFVTVYVEKLAETEKAVRVLIDSGKIVGSYKGWKTWVPKNLCVI